MTLLKEISMGRCGECCSHGAQGFGRAGFGVSG